LHPSEIIGGYNKANTQALELLQELGEPGSEKMDVKEKDQVVQRIVSAVASKHYGQESILCPIIAEACIQMQIQPISMRTMCELPRFWVVASMIPVWLWYGPQE
jgi:chaperonin GroEL (HSP60 family)